jgi:hypothetical protein
MHAPGQSLGAKAALSTDWKSKISPLLYLAGIGLAFVAPVASYVLYALVATPWLADRRIERFMKDRPHP